MRRRTFSLPFVLLAIGLAAPAAAQETYGPEPGPDAPSDYRRALSSLADGDTATAIRRLREATEAAPDYGPAWLQLGAVLSAQAGELEREFEGRLAAREVLEEAVRLMPGDPIALLEYGLLLRKQQIRLDAERVLERAWEAAERRGESLPPAERARLHYELGKIYEAWWEDWHGLINIPETELGTLACSRVDQPPSGSGGPVIAFLAVYCPEAWAELVDRAGDLTDLKDDERQRMLAHFRRAFEADPSHVDAAVRLLGHVADAGDWQEYQEVVRQLLLANPNSARAHLFRGLGLHRQGQPDAARNAFEQAIEQLPEQDRRVFEDISALLPPDVRERFAELEGDERERATRVFFASRDPLFLTDAQERRLEHYARLAWAELKFSAPASELRGWDSERGRVWVRYGQPWRRVQCCYGDARGTNSVGFFGAIEEQANQSNPTGRHHIWSYGENGPVFAFARALTYRRARLTGPAKQVADELERTAPEAYQPRTIAAIHGLPHQLVRFRGTEPALTRVELYAGPPLDSLGTEAGDGVETGVFVFDGGWTPLWQHRDTARVRDRALGLTYRIELPAGVYRYGLEARPVGPDTAARPIARVRAALETTGYATDRLALSDLLLADTIRPRRDLDAPPTTRNELVIRPKRALVLGREEPLHLYFELYGLRPDEDGFAGYEAELAVADSTERNLVQRLARGVQELFRRGEDPSSVRWERVTEAPDGTAMDWVRVELPALEPGEYVIEVRVRDAATGDEASARRRVRVPDEQPDAGP